MNLSSNLECEDSNTFEMFSSVFDIQERTGILETALSRRLPRHRPTLTREAPFSLRSAVQNLLSDDVLGPLAIIPQSDIYSIIEYSF